MLFIWRLVISLVVFAFSTYVLARTEAWVRFVGKNVWGEKWFGPGGTYTLWKLVGVILAAIAIAFLVGWRK
jgi:hypothetical protein